MGSSRSQPLVLLVLACLYASSKFPVEHVLSSRLSIITVEEGEEEGYLRKGLHVTL